jgi:hypothetical protein
VLRRFTTALVVAVSTAVAVGIASPANASNAGSFVSQINADRARVGRTPLVHRADLAALALRHSQTMAEQNSLHHNPNLTGQVSGWQSVGENVGMGGNTRVLHRAFMNSPAHRSNILDKDFTEIGLGVVVDGRGVMWVTEVFRQPLASSATLRAHAVATTSVARRTRRTLAVATTSAATGRPVAKRPVVTRRPAVRWASATVTMRPSRTLRSSWIRRLSSAAATPAAHSAGALPQAVQYLHVVAG